MKDLTAAFWFQTNPRQFKLAVCLSITRLRWMSRALRFVVEVFDLWLSTRMLDLAESGNRPSSKVGRFPGHCIRNWWMLVGLMVPAVMSGIQARPHLDPFQFVSDAANLDAEEFETNFPKKVFFQFEDIADTLFFCRFKKCLDRYREESTSFLFHLYTEPVDQANYERGNIETLICLGEGAAKLLFIKHPDAAPVAELIGTHVMHRVHHELNEGLQSGKYEISQSEVQKLVSLLNSNAFPVTLKPSGTEKAWYHIRNGNWGYLWDRFLTRYLTNSLTYGVLPLSILLNLYMYYKSRKFKKTKEAK